MLAVEPEEPAHMVVDAVRACFFKCTANRNRHVAEMPTGASSSFWQGSQYGCRRAGTLYSRQMQWKVIAYGLPHKTG